VADGRGRMTPHVVRRQGAGLRHVGDKRKEEKAPHSNVSIGRVLHSDIWESCWDSASVLSYSRKQHEAPTVRAVKEFS